MLTPVTFRTGRQHLPRLSEPYAPGRHSARFWSDAEIDVLRDNYAKHGAAGCLIKLPGRTLSGVYGMAAKLRLRTSVSVRAAPIGTSLDDRIKARWPSLAGQGAVAALANELGCRRHTLSQRALALGLTLPHRREPPWCAAENELLLRAPVNDPERASKFFAAHGFKRSPASIMVRCKRMRVSRRRQDVFSGTSAARLLGIDNKTMTSWCSGGLVRADRRGTKRLPQQGGDVWSIQPADLRRFIVDELDRLDIRKVDKHAFVALLIGDQQDKPASPKGSAEAASLPPGPHAGPPAGAEPTPIAWWEPGWRNSYRTGAERMVDV